METPILLVSLQQTNLNFLQKNFEDLGFTISISNNDKIAPNIVEKPLTIISCNSKTRIEPWLSYVEQGGILIIINPNMHVAEGIGIKEYDGECSEGILSFKLYKDKKPIEMQIKAKLSKFRKASGKIKGTIKIGGKKFVELPGIVENIVGKGKTLALLFPLEELISFFHQRINVSQLEKMKDSAEKIALIGIDKNYTNRPQLDTFLGFLSGYIVNELARIGRPLPRIGYLPDGYRNLITFGFDDFCISGKPIKNEFEIFKENLKANKKIFDFLLSCYKFFKKVIPLFFQYHRNYLFDVRRLVDILKMYDARSSAFLLPFVSLIKNKPGLTGYIGFSKNAFNYLKENGWDIGTHIKPKSLNDYNKVFNKFVKRFGVPPNGHRGHQLGWVDYDLGWKRLNELGYIYDSTWTWGGHNKLSWILGSSSPYHPIDPNGHLLSIFEVPVVGWIEDMYKTPEEGIKHIKDCLDLYPGLFNFAGHSWRAKEKAYVDFIEQIVSISKMKLGVGVCLTLHEICEFLTKREQSKIVEVCWDAQNYVISFETDSMCESHDLSVLIPFKWESRKIDSIYIEESKAIYCAQELWGVPYATITMKSGISNVKVKYS